jgi:ferredoxin
MTSEEKFEVRLLPQDVIFRAGGGDTLLLAGLAAGLPLPRSCRNGTCRACISRLLQGRIEHRIPWPGLSAEEKAEGLILPCVAEARSDLCLRIGPG